MKILFDQPSKGDPKENAQNRSYFCSELVAKAFKVLDVLKYREKGSNNYLPGSFEFNRSIDEDLKDEICLGPPLNILINHHSFLARNSPL